MLTQLTGFGSAGGGDDATPDAIDFVNISDSGLTATAFTNVVTIAGIDTTITLRLTLTVDMTAQHTVSVFRDGAFTVFGNAGATIDVTVANGQTLEYAFANSQNSTVWSGVATVTNESDGGAALDSFTYTLTDTGAGGGVVTL